MRVLHVAYTTYSRDPRVQSYVRMLEAAGIPCEVWALEEPGAAAPDASTRIVRYGRKYQGTSAARYALSYFAFFARTMLRALSRPRAYSIVHCHNMPNFLVFAFIVSRALGARIILDNHDVMPVVLLAKRDLAPEHWLARALQLEQDLSGRFADHLLTADDNQRDYLVERGRAPERVGVQLNLPDPALFRRRDGRRREGPVRFVYHGTVTRRLGLDLAVRAVALARRDVPGVELHVIGAGDGLAEIEALVLELGLEDTVHLSRGFHPVEELPRLLSTMDVGVVPNRRTAATDRFMLPVKLLEYTFLGMPAIVPDLAIIRRYFEPDMVRYHRSGDVADLAAAMVELASEPVSRAALAARAARFTERHGWEARRNAYLDLLSRLAR